MDTQILPSNFQSYPPHERRKWLEANADKTAKDKTVYKDLSDSQMDALETEISAEATALQDENDAYTEVKKEYRESLNAIKASLAALINKRKTGQEEITTDIFYIADQETGRMHGFAPDGVEVENRRLTEEERQTTIHSMTRTAN